MLTEQKDGLIKTFGEIDRQWKQTIPLKEDGLKYKNKINGSFSLFEFKETISNYFNCVSYYHYYGRALVNLNC